MLFVPDPVWVSNHYDLLHAYKVVDVFSAGKKAKIQKGDEKFLPYLKCLVDQSSYWINAQINVWIWMRNPRLFEVIYSPKEVFPNIGRFILTRKREQKSALGAAFYYVFVCYNRRSELRSFISKLKEEAGAGGSARRSVTFDTDGAE